jgi:hypothetical protein
MKGKLDFTGAFVALDRETLTKLTQSLKSVSHKKNDLLISPGQVQL